jgi:carbon monoxide dehydrogenase subunit G
MIEIRLHTAIAAPPETVYAFLTQIDNFPKWQEGLVRLEQLDPGPWHAGMRIKTIHSFLIWNNLEDFSEIAALEPGRRIANQGAAGKNRYSEEFLLLPEGAGTRLEYRADIEPGGIFRYLKTISAWSFRSQMRRSFSRLKVLLEAEAPVSSSLSRH